MKAIPAVCAIAACFLAGSAAAAGLSGNGGGAAEFSDVSAPAAISIPEPALAVLLGLVGVFMLLRRR